VCARNITEKLFSKSALEMFFIALIFADLIARCQRSPLAGLSLRCYRSHHAEAGSSGFYFALVSGQSIRTGKFAAVPD
jgi:hypothetical protein